MGSNLSQSQNLREMFPATEYEVMPTDPVYPHATIIKRKTDNILLILVASSQAISEHNHVLRVVERQQCTDQHYQLLEWSPISLANMHRYLTADEYEVMLEGAIEAYSHLSKTTDKKCLYICPCAIRVFIKAADGHRVPASSHQVSIPGNLLYAKVVPPAINKAHCCSFATKIVSKCTHRGGTLSDSQMLGQNFLHLSHITQGNQLFNSTVVADSSRDKSKWHQIATALGQGKTWQEILHFFKKSLRRESHHIARTQVRQNQRAYSPISHHSPSPLSRPLPQNIQNQNKYQYQTQTQTRKISTNLEPIHMPSDLRNPLTMIQPTFKNQTPKHIIQHQQFHREAPLSPYSRQRSPSPIRFTYHKGSKKCNISDNSLAIASEISQMEHPSPDSRRKSSPWQGKDQQFGELQAKPICFQPSLQSTPCLELKGSGIPNRQYLPKTTPDFEQSSVTSSVESSFEISKVKNNKVYNNGKKLFPESVQSKGPESSHHLLAAKFETQNLTSVTANKQIYQKGDLAASQVYAYGGKQSTYSKKNLSHHKIYLPSGTAYEGDILEEQPHRNGKLFYPSGRLAYQGNFRFGVFEGQGKLFNEDPAYVTRFDYTDFAKLEAGGGTQTQRIQTLLGSTESVRSAEVKGYWKFYEGEFKQGKKHGEGTLVLENGEKFEGGFVRDKVEGEGVFYGKQNVVRGLWKSNLLIKEYK